MPRPFRTAVVGLLGMATLLVACVAPSPSPGLGPGLSIGFPTDGQALAGTVAVIAGGYGGSATDLEFTLGAIVADANDDGIAIVDTTVLADGAYVLRATAAVGGAAVEDAVDVIVDNTVTASATVGAEGGTLRSGEGSLALLAPGSLAGVATLALEDTTQQQILDEFGVDYPALGVTFLGSLTVDATGTATTGTRNPIQVDLAGWAPAVQPGQDVVMFNVFPDVDGDGIGELTFAARAIATPGGSVISYPPRRAELYGMSSGHGSLRTQQTSTVRPGELVSLQGRGLTPHSTLGNTARFSSGEEILVLLAGFEAPVFNPLQDIVFAVPSLGSGVHEVVLVNGTTNFESDPLAIRIGDLGTGDGATWSAFLDQLDAAVTGVTTGRPALVDSASFFLGAFGTSAAGSATVRAMVANSGLVSPENLAALQGIDALGYTDVQRDLVRRHALLLDAIAVSEPGIAAKGADLASLLAVATPTGSSSTTLRRQQTSGTPCTSGPSAPIVWGSPTGMGSAPPGGCSGGSVGGSGSGGGSPLVGLRVADYGPVEGALVRVYSPDGSRPISPFTYVSDASGQFYIPFLPANEPFLMKAYDPATGDTAEAAGVVPDVGFLTDVPLAFAPEGGGPFEDIDFTINEIEDDFEGGGNYALDAVVTLPEGVEVDEYRWHLDGRLIHQSWASSIEVSLLREGSYDVELIILDTDGVTRTVTKTIVVDDLPYDYAAGPPTRVNVTADGTEALEDPNFSEYQSFVSGDGSHVLFRSAAPNLVPGDTNGAVDVFLKDVATGELERISVAEDGSQANGSSGGLGFHLAADETFAAFHSDATNIASDCLAISCSYVLDRSDGTLETLNDAAISGAIYATPVLSPDGSRAAFVLTSRSGCGSNTCQITVRDLGSGAQFTGSTASDGTPGNGTSRLPRFTGDGTSLVFQSRADNLVPGDTNGVDDIFLKDLETGAIVRVSTTADGTGANGRNGWPAISHDGRYVVFFTEADNLVPGGAGGNMQIVRKDLDTGAIDLVSQNGLGLAANNDFYYPSISADGRFVAFGGYGSDVVPGTNFDLSCGCANDDYNNGQSFLRDMELGRTVLLSYDGTGWLDEDDTVEPEISADGRYVVFTSAAATLVPNDTNGARDVFRVENPFWGVTP